MEITKAGRTLVFSDATPEELKRILQAAKKPDRAQIETYTRKEVGKIFKIHPLSCKRWEKVGILNPIKVTPRKVLYLKSEVLELLNKRGRA